jgi:hypothetical protein
MNIFRTEPDGDEGNPAENYPIEYKNREERGERDTERERERDYPPRKTICQSAIERSRFDFVRIGFSKAYNFIMNRLFVQRSVKAEFRTTEMKSFLLLASSALEHN